MSRSPTATLRYDPHKCWWIVEDPQDRVRTLLAASGSARCGFASTLRAVHWARRHGGRALIAHRQIDIYGIPLAPPPEPAHA